MSVKLNKPFMAQKITIDVEGVRRAVSAIFGTECGLILHPNGTVSLCDYDEDGHAMEFLLFPSMANAQLFAWKHSIADSGTIRAVRLARERAKEAMLACRGN
jgi:hypothetical protein